MMDPNTHILLPKQKPPQTSLPEETFQVAWGRVLLSFVGVLAVGGAVYEWADRSSNTHHMEVAAEPIVIPSVKVPEESVPVVVPQIPVLNKPIRVPIDRQVHHREPKVAAKQEKPVEVVASPKKIESPSSQTQSSRCVALHGGVHQIRISELNLNVVQDGYMAGSQCALKAGDSLSKGEKILQIDAGKMAIVTNRRTIQIIDD